MSSANGYNLTITKNNNTFTVAASWAAPFFSFSWIESADGSIEPFLYHAESLEDARRIGGKILNSDFTIYGEAA
jgi:hypothetical protein